ncbi:MAG: TonB-dependent receptor [Bacteroidaceae bacterium]|nr:TonB-dependent receptor [Prevotella sp.]MBQ6432466.1 TonB-dependent receptor [Bacteroidaceae bacterium]
MKRTMLLVATAMTMTATAQDADSLKMEKLQEVVVSGVRTQKDAPYATTNIKRQELNRFSTTGQELPFLFARTPGVLAWSENGVGTGTTYMRIRGAGDSRINVTLDGVPLNSPEDQCVYWANMNSYGALLGSVQIQRGVGTSTNGDGAFGGTVALASKAPMQRPSAEVSASYGSYNTYNLGGTFSTGLLWKHFIVDGAYHETNTDGFIHGTAGRSGSYYGGLSWVSDDVIVRYKNFGNFEKTGQAWNGVTAGSNDYSLMDGNYDDGSWAYQTKTGIKTYGDLYDHGLGKYNSLYERLVTGDDGLFVKDANGNYLTERYQMADGSYWPKTTDNFWQNHNLLTAALDFGERWRATATLHYTHGYGYYNEFRPQYKLAKFGLIAADADGNNIKKADFVRKKGYYQDAYGMVGSVNYNDDRWDIIGGLSVQNFESDHFGYLTYTSNATVRQLFLRDGDYQYYDSDASKFDASVYVKAAYQFTDQWKAFADLQYRHVGYKTSGINDKFYEEASRWYNQELNIDEKYDFLNPKAGISWSKGPHHAFASVAVSHREPERNNFTDNFKYPFPKAESLMDYELGYNYSTRQVRLGANLYYMDYTDQFVQTGELSEIGENLTTNIKDSYRMGVELTAAWNVLPVLTLEGNAALSQNKLKDFTEMASVDWESSFRPIHYDNTTLAFSPSAILNGFVDFHWRGLQAAWHTNFVSRQYLDNTENKDRSLPAYSASNLRLSYTLRTPRRASQCAFPFPHIKEAIFSFNVSNVFDAHYAASGWVYSSILDDYGHTNDNRYYQIGFIPMAGRTVLGSVTLKF